MMYVLRVYSRFVLNSSIVLLLLQHCYLAAARQCKDYTGFVPQSSIQERGVLYHFSKCSKDTNCSACSDNDASQIIREASICEDDHISGVCKFQGVLPHTDRHFSAHIPGDQFDHAGQYDFNLTYQYSCENEQHYNESMLCLQQFRLSLGVTDFNLILTSSQALVTVDGNDAVVAPQEGDSVTFKCSSGLPNEVNIPVHFLFTPESDSDAQTVMICDEFYHKPVYYDDNWVVERQRHDAHSCLLHVLNFSLNESGNYSCAGILPPGGIGDWSERWISIILSSKIEIPPRDTSTSMTFSTILGAIFGTIVFFIAITFIGFCIVIGISLKLGSRPALEPPRPDPPPPAAGVYGAVNQTEPLVRDEEEESSSESDEDTDIDASDTEVAEQNQPVVIRNRDNAVVVQVDVEPSSNGTIVPLDAAPQANTGHQTSTGPQANAGPHPCTGSQANAGPQATPAPLLQPTIITSPESPEPTIVTVPSKGTLFPPGFVAEPPETTVRSKDPPPQGPPLLQESQKSRASSSISTNSQQLLFDVSLENSSKSASAGDGYPSNTSSSSTDSEDTKARKAYEQGTHLPPAEGTTPDSRAPIDPNYTCPKCGKRYARDQRQYFTRHMEECEKPS